jgi:hypothetical protein
MKKLNLYGTFEKCQKLPDGTLIVQGVASSEAVDKEGEVIKADAMRKAIPDYMKFGAVREMHQPIAAGVCLKCEVRPDDKTYIEAKIVDPSTVKKVEEGVLKGFSISGKATERDSLNKSIVTALKLTEISLVDSPCNPDALVTMFKADDDKDEDKDEEEKSEGGEEKDEEEKEDEEEKSDDADDEEDEDEDKEKFAKLSKAHGDALMKILKMEAKLKKANKEIAKLKAMPAAPKAARMAISKGEDVIGSGPHADLKKQAEAFVDLPPQQQAEALAKLIQNHGA